MGRGPGSRRGRRHAARRAGAGSSGTAAGTGDKQGAGQANVGEANVAAPADVRAGPDAEGAQDD